MPKSGRRPQHHFRPRQRALLRDPLPLDPESRRQVPMRNWSRMEWTGCAAAPNGSESALGLVRTRSTTMPCSTIRAVATIGIDMGKNTLHMIGLDSRGAIVREKVSRGRISSRLANLPPCLIGIEAGVAAHYGARGLCAAGPHVKPGAPTT